MAKNKLSGEQKRSFLQTATDPLATAGKSLGSNLLSNVEGILSVKPMAKYMTGARCVLKVNGRLIGFAFNISWNIRTTVTELRTIDSYVPSEIVPKHVIVDGTIGCLHIPGLGPLNDNPASMQADIVNFLHQKYITIEVRDSQTDNLLFYTNKAMVTSRSESYSSEQMGQMTLQWQAIGWKDNKDMDYKVVDVLGQFSDDTATNKNSKSYEVTQAKIPKEPKFFA